MDAPDKPHRTVAFRGPACAAAAKVRPSKKCKRGCLIHQLACESQQHDYVHLSGFTWTAYSITLKGRRAPNIDPDSQH